MNTNLINYIENNIIPEYLQNEPGHGIEHINYVIKRSMEFAKQVKNINNDMVYTIAAYHDIGDHIDRKHHEVVSACILLNDINLLKYFSKEELNIMAMAIADHRASLNREPRSIYGKIISSADRSTSIEDIITRTFNYCVNHDFDNSLEVIAEKSYEHLSDKFGTNGYANSKIYFHDEAYQKFIKDISLLLADKNKFISYFISVNYEEIKKLFQNSEIKQIIHIMNI